MTRSSNIRVSVQFKQPAVFAGEDVECIITFTNHTSSSSTLLSHDERLLPSSTRRISDAASRSSQAQRYRHLQHPGNSNRPNRAGSIASTPTSPRDERIASSEKGRLHGRSISITSFKSDDATLGENPNQRDANDATGGRTLAPGHSRASSVQAHSHRQKRDGNESLSRKRASLPPSGNGNPSIVFPDGSNETRGDRRNPDQARPINNDTRRTKRSPTTLKQEFKFPATPSEHSPVSESPGEEADVLSVSNTEDIGRRHSPTARDGLSDSSLNPISRLLSGTSINGTPRSSIELYSGSNHSDETMASEYPTQQFSRQPARGNSFRHSSKLADVVEHVGPEHLMMGYAQVAGSFTLDGSLVNQNPFEEVKRRSVVGGQGAGGVVGVERKKRDSGLLGSFGWANIGDSIGGLLGSGEMSSIREMRTKANSKAIPLLSTPHSILFVDLKLNPGESQRFRYKLTLPKGLPPTHRGRAMKVTYHLQIGIQKPGTKTEQRMRTIEVPFRIFGTVNARGEVLFHDLLSPQIFLRDLAHTSCVSDSKKGEQPSQSDLPSFLSYVETLLTTNTTASGLLSPTVPNTPHMRRTSSLADVTTSKEAIDLAVMRSNQAQRSNLSTRFTITRSSRPVAVLMLPRSAYRLGETIHLIVDFSVPPADKTSSQPPSQSESLSSAKHIPVYAVLVTLESHETIDPTIAMRSPQSIYRYTRKVHAQGAENALFARRLFFALAVPPSATPDFGTSGVGLEWRIRVEFMTPILHARNNPQNGDMAEQDEEEAEKAEIIPEEWEENEWPELLEEVASDDRGEILQGIEQMYVDTFEVAVPVRIYGAVVGSGSESDVVDLAV